ncbi:DoxX family protein [Roseibium sediminis]|uniref:DoxX family protein n=1 Tax=Roseibium sediminis TaxID=1775174 RepID=UPI00123E0B92|nr:hypothetical protein [Roseibium sediminis]
MVISVERGVSEMSKAKYIRSIISLMALLSSVGISAAHESWFLGSEEMEAISASIPPIEFISTFQFSLIMLPMAILSLIALSFEPKWLTREERFFAAMDFDKTEVASWLLSGGLAIMMAIAALGLLPMMGQEPGTSTLFVANAVLEPQRAYTPVLVAIQLALGVMLFVGFQVRLAAVGVICLAVAGHFLFGVSFLDFSLHFIAPALLVLSFGRKRNLFGARSSGCFLQKAADSLLKPAVIYPIARIMTGIGFVYLAFRYKFLEPGLIMTILDHTPLLFFKELAGAIVLIMGLVEFIAGILLILGVLVRPIALFLIFAFSFFALLLGESPFYHSQLYALCFVFLLVGPGNFTAVETSKGEGARFTALARTHLLHPGTFGNRSAMASLFGFIMFVVWYSIPVVHQTRLQDMNIHEVAGNQPAPELKLDIKKDAFGIWHAALDVQNFNLEQEADASETKDKVGHVHIFVDSKKVGTARSAKHSLGRLEPGRHVISASLVSTDHKLVVTPYGSITKRVEIHVPEHEYALSSASAEVMSSRQCNTSHGPLCQANAAQNKTVLRGSLAFAVN